MPSKPGGESSHLTGLDQAGIYALRGSDFCKVTTMQATHPLPQFRGPKLEPFRFVHDQTRDIEFLDPLGRGAHAEVWRVSIGGSVYALKLVCIPFCHFPWYFVWCLS